MTSRASQEYKINAPIYMTSRTYLSTVYYWRKSEGIIIILLSIKSCLWRTVTCRFTALVFCCVTFTLCASSRISHSSASARFTHPRTRLNERVVLANCAWPSIDLSLFFYIRSSPCVGYFTPNTAVHLIELSSTALRPFSTLPYDFSFFLVETKWVKLSSQKGFRFQ